MIGKSLNSSAVAEKFATTVQPRLHKQRAHLSKIKQR